MSRSKALDRLTNYAHELRATDEEAAILLQSLIANAPRREPKPGKRKMVQVRSKAGDELFVPEDLITEAMKR